MPVWGYNFKDTITLFTVAPRNQFTFFCSYNMNYNDFVQITGNTGLCTKRYVFAQPVSVGNNVRCKTSL